MLRSVALVRTDVSEELSVVFLRSVRRLLVTASVIPSSSILFTLIMEALSSSETSVITRATQRNIPEDGILLFATVYCCLNLVKSIEVSVKQETTLKKAAAELALLVACLIHLP
jgi:hypothetical protein